MPDNPTKRQLLNRIYRLSLTHARELETMRTHMRVLTEHAERLMREKIVLQEQLASANKFMGAPMQRKI